MFNKEGIQQQSYAAPRQILANVDLQSSLGCRVLQAAGVTVGTKKIVKAGTPVYGDVFERKTGFAAETTVDTSVKGVYTVQITTAAARGGASAARHAVRQPATASAAMMARIS